MQRMKIYTDGSHFKHTTDYIGIGAYCKHKGREYMLSLNCNENILNKYNLEKPLSNPTAEFIAFAEVLHRLSPASSADFYIDYIGVKNWMSGEWRAKQKNIIRIKETCEELIRIKELNVIIYHIRGHSGINENEMADALAKSQDEIDTW